MLKQIEETSYISVPTKYAEQIKKIQSDKELGDIVNKYIEDYRNQLKSELSYLSDSVILFKAECIKVKETFSEAKKAEFLAIEEIWGKFEKDISKIRQKVKAVKDEVEPLKQELNEVKNLMNTINTWDIDRFLEIAKTLNNLMSGENKNILKFLFDNYKKD